MEFNVILTVLGLIFFRSHAAPLSEEVSEEKGEHGKYFEGDIILTAAQRAEIEKEIHSDGIVLSRNGVADSSKRWPNKTVVYYIKNDFDKAQIEKIHSAISDLKNQSCIEFRERKSKDEYALVFQGDPEGCYSYIGYIGIQPNSEVNGQVLNLDVDCFERGLIEHEILHALGFYHMQSTYDRDDFVTIVWENIQEGYDDDFKKHTKSTVDDFGVPYDYGSVMHYGRKEFSKNGKDTIIPKQANVTIGQRVGLSKRDVLKLNKMYDCPEIEESNRVQ